MWHLAVQVEVSNSTRRIDDLQVRAERGVLPSGNPARVDAVLAASVAAVEASDEGVAEALLEPLLEDEEQRLQRVQRVQTSHHA